MIDDTELDMEFDKNPTKPQKLIREVNKANSAKSIEAKTLELDRQQKNLVNTYKNEKQISVRVAPAYAKYFGRVMRVSINGIMIAVRCDGKDVLLPESFAAEVLRRMSEMDKYDNRRSKMADITRNYETSPGQLNFFG